MKYPEYITDADFIHESEEEINRKIDALIAAMTTGEKAELCHGGINPPVPGQIGNGGYLKGVPRLGVPEIRMYDGPAGPTSIYETTGLPAEEMLASTWSRALAAEFGRSSGSENHMDAGNCQLGAEMDIVRTTHFNRTRDMMGEDPFLAGELGKHLSAAVQKEHVMTCLKHFAGYIVSANPANASNTIMDEQTLHELYLQPFEKCMKEGNASCVMTAYNRLNGEYASSSGALMKDILRDQWNYDGFVMCDWGANHSFSLKKGMEMEMPAGAYNSTERILGFLNSGKCSMEDLDLAVRHILSGMAKAGYLSLVKLGEDGRVLSEEGRMEPIRIPLTYIENEALREKNAETAELIAEKGAVLLKNKGALPLKQENLRKHSIALVGAAAKYPVCGYGQERSYGTLKYQTSPFEELAALSDPDVLNLQPGLDFAGDTIPAEYFYPEENEKVHGIRRFYGISKEDGYRPPLMSMGGEGQEFKGTASRDEEADEDDDPSLHFVPAELFMPGSDAMDMAGHETGSEACVDSNISFTTKSRNYKNGKDGNAFEKGTAYTWKGYLEAPESGEYQLNLHAIGGVAVFKMMIDGENYTDIGVVKMREGTQWPWGNLFSTPTGMEICCTRVTLEKGKRYPFVVYGKALLAEKDLQLELAWHTPSEEKRLRADALNAAEEADSVIYFIQEGFQISCGLQKGGLNFAEGVNIELDADQKALLKELSDTVHAHGGKLTVIAYNGSTFAMKDWINQADALLYMWMPGQGGSRALTRLLTGAAVPSGKTAQTFPNTNEDTLITYLPGLAEERFFGKTEGKPYPNVYASEGIYTGYRWYEHENRKPLFEFGFGLSYTTFSYGNLSIREDDGETVVSFDVTNTGSCTADEIVQIYLGKGQVPAHIKAAEKTLCGFERLENIRPGETRHAEVRIPTRSFMYWDPEAEFNIRPDGTKDKWQTAHGKRKIFVGASSADIRLTGTVTV